VMTPGGPFYTSQDLTQLDPTRPIKIVLVWTDAQGTVGANYPLKNDLDLIVHSRQYTSLFAAGNKFDSSGANTGRSSEYGLGVFPTWDRVNNVEMVIPPGDLGQTFWIEVRNVNITADALSYNATGAARQDFALFVENVH
jgi:hypothetical protein